MKKQPVRADFSALGAVATNIETMSNILMCNTQAKKHSNKKRKGRKLPFQKITDRSHSALMLSTGRFFAIA